MHNSPSPILNSRVTVSLHLFLSLCVEIRVIIFWSTFFSSHCQSCEAVWLRCTMHNSPSPILNSRVTGARSEVCREGEEISVIIFWSTFFSSHCQSCEAVWLRCTMHNSPSPILNSRVTGASELL